MAQTQQPALGAVQTAAQDTTQTAAQPSSQPDAQALPQSPQVPAISKFTPGVPTTQTGSPLLLPSRSSPVETRPRFPIGPYGSPKVPRLFAGNGDRLRSLVHDGKLYLSAKDAIALAIENNLDVEIERANLLLATTDQGRAAGGGTLRGIDFTIEEPPSGVGGPGSPLLNIAAINPNPTTPTVTDLTSLNATNQITTNLSASSTATAQYSLGPSIPIFDPNIFLEAGYLRRSNTVSLLGNTNGAAIGTPTDTAAGATTNQAQPIDFLGVNLSYVQGFHSGAQLVATANNDATVLYANRNSFDPASRPSTYVTLTQPLLRGRGQVNTRFLKIANENRKISRLLFQQQVLETVYGVSRLYFDLVSLGENVAVQQEALLAAQKLRADDADQVAEGTLAPIELTRVKALVSSSEFALIQAQGLYRTQEVILRNQLIRADQPVFAADFSEIVPTDVIVVPEALTQTSVADLMTQALANRPDLAQAALQLQTGRISADASRNQARPQLNAYANVQTRGASEQTYEQLGSTGTGIPALPQNFASGGLRISTIVQAGIQLNLPLRNRVAVSDAARDRIQLTQVEARGEKIANQIRVDVENASIAVNTAFAAYQASRASRGAQEQLLAAERDKLAFGQSTPLAVLQFDAYVAQARSTEIAARSNYQKAAIELDRSLGDLLDKNGILLEDAVQGRLKP